MEEVSRATALADRVTNDATLEQDKGQCQRIVTDRFESLRRFIS